MEATEHMYVVGGQGGVSMPRHDLSGTAIDVDQLGWGGSPMAVPDRSWAWCFEPCFGRLKTGQSQLGVSALDVILRHSASQPQLIQR